MNEKTTVKLARRGFFRVLADWCLKLILLVTAGGGAIMSLSFMFPPRKLMQRLTGWVPTVDNKGLKKGEVAQVMFNGTPFYILKTPQDKLFSYSAVCPHAACIVQWNIDDQHFKCPCHESVFDSLGNPSGGPATEPLTRLELKTDETGKIFIKLV